MAQNILTYPDPVLRQVCAPVEVFDEMLSEFCDTLFHVMYAAEGRGLAAPQIGRAQRVFVMDMTWKEGKNDRWICINPALVWSSDETDTCDEVCLSIPGVAVPVIRPVAIGLAFQGRGGARREVELTGIAARCAQHELDHLNGIVTFDRADPAVGAPLLAAYLA